MLTQQGARVETIRTELVDRMDQIAKDSQAIRVDLPRDYVPRIELIGRWNEDERRLSEIKSDVRDLRGQVRDLEQRVDTMKIDISNRISSDNTDSLKGSLAAKDRLNLIYVQIACTILGPIVGAICTILVLRR